MSSTVILGFSGGVDSAVSAMLLKKQGYEVHGLYLDNSGEKELNDALAGAENAGIPLDVVDVKKELEENVCIPFAGCYLRGETPNPCIICNPNVKFKNLLAVAEKKGADFIATGHYARAENGYLYKGHPENDQSYMLCRLTRPQVNRLLLPLGSFPKREVRAMAAEFGLPVASKPDSMEICFIPDKDYIGWLGKRVSLPGEGDLILNGETVGTHKGIHCYTVGQRYPGLMNGRKVYISKINAPDNTVILSYWDDLFKTEVRAKDFSWLCDVPSEPIRASVRVRHTKWENPECTVYPEGESVRIVCDEPVRAPAAGQSAVLYSGDRVLGGGFIVSEP